MVLMIENWRNSTVWGRMMRNPDIQRGMRRAGFTPVTVSVEDGRPGPAPDVLWVQPNPCGSEATIRFRMNQAGRANLGVFDASGRRIADLAGGEQAAGFHEVRWDATRVPAGIYFARLEWNGHIAQHKLVRVN
jgi:hypothetical protein